MIKVLKPGIEQILVADLNFVYIVARILEFANPELSRTSLVNKKQLLSFCDLISMHLMMVLLLSLIHI